MMSALPEKFTGSDLIFEQILHEHESSRPSKKVRMQPD